MTTAEKSDNADEDSGNMELSSCPFCRVRNDASSLLYSFVNKIVEDDESDEGNEAETEN